MPDIERIARAVTAIVFILALVGCANPRAQDGAGSEGASLPTPLAPEPQRVVEEYLQAARSADGGAMYALIASSERDEETPESLKDTAVDRYSANTSWNILKVEEKENTAEVVVEFEGAKVDPNPYRFTLTRETGEWRIVEAPELHEDDDDADIKIKF